MKALAKGWLLFCIAVVSLGAASEEIRVRCQPDKTEVLFGEPVYATYEVENVSQAPVYVHAIKRGEGLMLYGWKARAVGPKGGVPVREMPVHGSPEFKYALAPGEQATARQPLPITDVTRPELAPGVYELRLQVEYSLTPAEREWEKRASCSSEFWVKEAAGDDAAWLAALETEAKAASRADLRRYDPNAPLGWYEVLEGTTKNQIPSLLTRFPTSTYAGYVLRAPPASFGCSTYECFDSPEETLRRECDRGGGDKPTQECMRKERERMEGYAKHAAQFLEAHPDFFDAPRIRRYLAYCLAFTGRVPEALTQLRILAEGTGAEALEAKAFLEKRAASKCRG
ncbi:MAG: hypothetical protein ACOYXN_03110 [Acidobacteriota bacterium]